MKGKKRKKVQEAKRQKKRARMAGGKKSTYALKLAAQKDGCFSENSPFEER